MPIIVCCRAEQPKKWICSDEMIKPKKTMPAHNLLSLNKLGCVCNGPAQTIIRHRGD